MTSEETKIWTLRAGLSPGLKVEIRYQDEPTDPALFINLFQNADMKMKAYQAENSHRHLPAPTPAPTRQPAPPTAPAPTPTHASHAPGGLA